MFADRYRSAFAALDLPLQPEHGLEAESIAAMPLADLRLPRALADYYEVAGNETVLNHCYNRLLSPDEVFVESGRIAFMEENQAVVYWGVRGASGNEIGVGDNPPLEQGTNVEGEALGWYTELTDCAEFLVTMLYWHASFGGGLEFCASSTVRLELKTKLDEAFQLVGTVDQLVAYGRQGCALTFIKWVNDEWRLFGGFSTVAQQFEVGNELGLQWDDH
jgi:hypothetical protein